MATQSSILAWKIPLAVEPAGLQFIELDTTESLPQHTQQRERQNDIHHSIMAVWNQELLMPITRKTAEKILYGKVYKDISVSSVAQLCPTLCDPMECSTPDSPVHHQLLEFRQTYVHWLGDCIQLSHSVSSPSLPVFSLSQHQGVFQRVSSSHQVAKVLELHLQHLSFQWMFRTDFL